MISVEMLDYCTNSILFIFVYQRNDTYRCILLYVHITLHTLLVLWCNTVSIAPHCQAITTIWTVFWIAKDVMFKVVKADDIVSAQKKTSSLCYHSSYSLKIALPVSVKTLPPSSNSVELVDRHTSLYVTSYLMLIHMLPPIKCQSVFQDKQKLSSVETTNVYPNMLLHWTDN